MFKAISTAGVGSTIDEFLIGVALYKCQITITIGL